MTYTFFDVLQALPADATLCTFLRANGLALPEDLSTQSLSEASASLVEALRTWPDAAARDRLIGKLMSSVQLDGPSGRRAMFQVVASNGTALMGLVDCASDLHRSFWLHVHYPHLFEQACDLDYLERHGSRAQQHDLGVRRRPDASDAALTELRHTIARFYQRELQCGDASAAYLVERSPGVFLLTVHVKDLAALSLEFDGGVLTRRVGHPNIHMVLEYAMATGVARTMVRGGEKYHRMLLDAFAKHLLGGPVDSQRIKPVLDLSRLRLGFDVPQAVADGFTTLQVKSITVLKPQNALRLDCMVMATGGRESVTDLLREEFGSRGPLCSEWVVTAASLNLYYPPAPGRSRCRVVTVEVSSRGSMNLHKFDPKLQSQLEGYLVALGVLQPHQRLRMAMPDADLALEA